MNKLHNTSNKYYNYNWMDAESKKRTLGTSEVKMLWHCIADPRFSYYVDVPSQYKEEVERKGEILVIIHGTGRRVQDELNLFRKNMGDQVALLAPLLPAGLIDEDDFNHYKLISYKGIRYDYILIQMINEMVLRYPGLDGRRVLMYGYSGGGQYCNRFFYLHPEHLKAVALSAPGRSTYLDETLEYTWGIKDWEQIFEKKVDREALASIPVQLSVGDLDLDEIGDAPYGTTRVARTQALFENFKQQGLDVQFDFIPGINHYGPTDLRLSVVYPFFKKRLK